MLGSSYRRALPAMAALFVCACPAAAADLLVAGTIGEVYMGDSHAGGFEYFGGICLAPIRSLGVSADSIFAGDENGGILRLDLATGVFMDLFWVPKSDATDVVVHGGDLLVSSSSGIVHRVDPLTGDVLLTMPSPISVQAMALDGDDLYVAGTIGEVYRGSAITGGFEPFAGICLGPIQALALDDARIYAGDIVGGVARFDRTTGDFLGAFFVPAPITAMVRDGADLLISGTGGFIRRFDPLKGELIDTLVSPVAVDAMEILAVPGDVDGDGFVGIVDLLALLGAWGPCPGPPSPCSADLDGDLVVGIVDLLALLSQWS